MKYISGKVGDLRDWHWISGADWERDSRTKSISDLISDAVSETLYSTLLSDNLPVYSELSGGSLDVLMYFSTDESDENKCLFRTSISDLVEWSIDFDESAESMDKTLQALKSAVVKYETAIENLSRNRR